MNRGEGPAIQLREPEKKAVAATAAGGGAGGGGEDVEILSERKLRARRMRAEKEMKEFQDRGEDVPAEVLAAVEKYSNMKPGVPYGGTGTAVAAASRPPVVAPLPASRATPTRREAARPPHACRARSQGARRRRPGESRPEIMAALAETGSDMASEEAKAAVASAAAAPAAGGEAAEGGDSPRKQRARRMRAERTAREALAAGEEVPEDVVATLASFNITLESLQSGD